MQLIADSGSTKTDWRLISEDETKSFSSIGFNPYHISENQVLEALENSGLALFNNQITEVFFYGAGCSSEKNCNFLLQIFGSFFPNAKIEVNHDLLAAARAACQKEKGMVAILGTGSNTCLYDGVEVIENIPALGYILGDEGSGAYIGKKLITKYLYNELNIDLKHKFENQYSLNKETILEAVYKKELPNKYLASFAKFVAENVEELEDLVLECFQDFFSKHICKYSSYREYDLHIIGSIGSVFKKQLENVAKQNEVRIGKLIKQPIEELVLFHRVD